MAEQVQENKPGVFMETLTIIVQALILAVLVRTLLFQPFSIPTGSMIPNLLIGDYLFVNKFGYGYSKYSIPFAPDLFEGRIWASEPKRGEIAVFKLPSDSSTDYIKRVVGLPGDKIQMKNGVLHINGEAVKRVAAGTFSRDDVMGGLEIPIYVETLPNGVSYETLDLTINGDGDRTGVFEVPEGHYFMMGDNRDNSLDSRFDVGFVPFENFVGPAKMIFFSVKNDAHPLAIWRWPTDMRFERLFSGL